MLFEINNAKELAPDYNESLFDDKDIQTKDTSAQEWLENLERWEQYKLDNHLDISPELDRTLKHLAYLSPLDISEVYEAIEHTPQDIEPVPCDVAYKQNEQEYIKHRWKCYNIWANANKEGGDNE